MRAIILALTIAGTACATAPGPTPPDAPPRALYPAEPDLSAPRILEAAYAASGGETWLRPRTLLMKGYAVFYRDGAATTYDDYRMWREFPAWKGDAHKADGKVRIEGKTKGETRFFLAFDGATTFDANGPVADQAANAQWAENFGFGAIRFGLDAGWAQRRLPDDFIDGEPAYFVELTDPAGAVTRFGVSQATSQILSVGFDTARGWHERRYSAFFTKPGVAWTQPGRVRLFYDGVKQNEVIWTDFELNAPFDPALFGPPRKSD